MIRKTLCMNAIAALVCLAATNFAQAQCASGGCATGAGCEVAVGGCATGQCGGGCLGGLFGGFHGGDCYELGGPCYTCENIWDGYCASKSRCLPIPNNPPHGKLFGGGCGGCNACAPGVGVYGRQTCPPLTHGHFLKQLFKPKAKCDSGCAAACANPGCDGATCDAGCAAAPLRYGPASSAAPLRYGPAPSAAPLQEGSASEEADVVPPAPAVTDQTKTSGRNSFDWLQRALQLN